MPLLSQARTNPSASPTVRSPFLIGGESLLQIQPSPKEKIPRSRERPGVKKTRSSSRNGISKDDLLTSLPPPPSLFTIWFIHAFVLLDSISYENRNLQMLRLLVVTFLFLISSQKIFIADKVAAKCRRTFRNSFQRTLQKSSFFIKEAVIYPCCVCSYNSILCKWYGEAL